MSLLEMQRALTRILTDEDFRRAFLADGAAALAGFALSDRERDSLCHLDRERVVIHAFLLQQGRVELALKAFPASAQLLRHRLADLVSEYCRANPPVPVKGPALLQEATLLQAFLRPHLAPMDPPYLAELFEYEGESFRLANGMDAWLSALDFESRNAADSQPSDLMRRIPMTGAHALVRAFTYPVAELGEAVVRGEVPPAPPPAPTPTWLLLSKRAHVLKLDVSRVNTLVRDLLALCDGRRTTEEVLEALAGQIGVRSSEGRHELFDKGGAALQRLRRAQVVAFQ
jgi:hypothetical protein